MNEIHRPAVGKVRAISCKACAVIIYDRAVGFYEGKVEDYAVEVYANIVDIEFNAVILSTPQTQNAAERHLNVARP